MICAILNSKGDNTYLNDTKGLTFGIRRHYLPTEDDKGVISVDVMMTEEDYEDTAHGVITRAVSKEIEQFEQIKDKELKRRKLKYAVPHLRDLDGIKLHDDFKEFFIKKMDVSLMDDELKQAWAPHMEEILQNQKKNQEKNEEVQGATSIPQSC